MEIPQNAVQDERLPQRVREWLGPGLFGLSLSAVILFHSSSWVGTLPEVAGILFAVVSLPLVLTRAYARLTIPRSISMLLLALAISMAVSTITSVAPGTSLPRLLLYADIALLATSVYVLYRDAGRIPVAAYCLVIAVINVPFVVAVVLGFIEADGRLFLDGPNVANFANIRHFGHVCFLAAMCSVALLVLSRRVFVPCVLTCCALFGIVACGSRGPLLAWIFFVGLLVYLGPKRARVAICGLITLAATVALVWYLDSSGLLVTLNIFTRIEDAVVHRGGDLDSGRIKVWIGTLREIAKHPVFGQGPEGYALSGCCDTWIKHPHNFGLQLLIEFGVAGSSILVLLMICALHLMGGARRLVCLVMAAPANRVMACALTSYVALGLIDGMFYFAVPLIHFALFCGLLAVGLHQARPIDRQGPVSGE